MAKDRNTIAKRHREIEKKRKAEEKRAKRRKRKEGGIEPDETTDTEVPVTEPLPGS